MNSIAPPTFEMPMQGGQEPQAGGPQLGND